MPNVLFIAYYFPPVGGAGVQRSHKFVQYLPAQGFVPIVVTGPLSSGDRWTPRDASLMASIPESVRIHRVGRSGPSSTGRTRERIRGLLGLPDAFAQWWISSATELACQVGRDADLIFATMSPFASAVVAQRAAERLGIPWVADLRDPWALDEMQVYQTIFHRRLELQRMRKLLSTASSIVMNTPEASESLKSAFPEISPRRIVTITNGFDREDFAYPVEQRSDSKFRIVHSGYLHTESGLQLRKRRYYRSLGGADPDVDILTRSHTILLDAISQWCAERPEIKTDLQVVLAGKSSRGDETIVEQSNVRESVQFTGYVAHSESLQLVRTADLLFLPMHNLPPHRRSRIVPGKTYEYMAAGRPILAAVPNGDARDFLMKCGTGLVCRPDDTRAMVKILDAAYQGWKEKAGAPNSNVAFVSQFERRNLVRQLAVTFGDLLVSGTRQHFVNNL